MRLVAYLRISTDGQRENSSLPVQYERIEKFCAFSGHEIVFCARDVETASGKRKRHGLELALNMLREGTADGLICLKLDRYARNVIEGLRIAQELKERGKQLILINENLDTSSPVGECIFTILLAFAQLEHATIKERITSGKEKVRRDGGYLEGRPPYGYMASKDERGKKMLVRHPEQYPWLVRIIRWRDLGWTYRRIADELNHLAIPTQSGGQWLLESVYSMLRHRKLAEWAEGNNHERSETDWQDAAS